MSSEPIYDRGTEALHDACVECGRDERSGAFAAGCGRAPNLDALLRRMGARGARVVPPIFDRRAMTGGDVVRDLPAPAWLPARIADGDEAVRARHLPGRDALFDRSDLSGEVREFEIAEGLSECEMGTLRPMPRGAAAEAAAGA